MGGLKSGGTNHGKREERGAQGARVWGVGRGAPSPPGEVWGGAMPLAPASAEGAIPPSQNVFFIDF